MPLTSPEFLAKLQQWNEAKQKLADVSAPLVAAEMQLRKEVFALAFPAPVEGTNTGELSGGWKLKGVYKIDRKLDNATFLAIKGQLIEVGVNPDTLVSYEPKLDTKAYKAMSDANRAIFDAALTAKPASPTLELVQPKEAK